MAVTSLAARLAGVILAPRTTFAAVAQHPRWMAVLILATLVSFLCGAAFYSTEVGQLALVDQWERTALAFGGTVDDSQYTRFLELSSRGTAYAALMAVLGGPMLTAGIAGGLFLVLRGMLGITVTFAQAMAIAAHAGVILALRNLIATPINYAMETVASPTTLIRLAGPLDESAPLARFLGTVDLFTIWWVVVLAIGAGVLARRPIRPLALAFASAYVALALALAGVMALTGGPA